MKIALVEFFVKEEQTIVFVIDPYNPESKQEPHVFTVDIKEEKIRFLKNMIWSFGKDDSIIKSKLSFFQNIASAFFKPVLDYLSACDILYIIPHKDLHYLPFHAAEIDGKTLCEHCAIVYLPSASLLKFCQENNILRKKKKFSYKQILSIGVGAREDTPNFQKNFHIEARQVGRVFQTARSICHTGRQATKAVFMDHAPQSDLIHVASHGFFDKDTPLGSGPLLADGKHLPPKKPDHDSKRFVLKAEEFYQLNLRANLMVLSGCLTGMSEVRAGDELLGLARGMFAAGIPSMIVSLWEAHHGATMQFMQIFYQELINGVPKALALQSAQRELRKNSEYQHIKYWAPFILIGDWL
jgi:CHAT domain-containing protein